MCRSAETAIGVRKEEGGIVRTKVVFLQWQVFCAVEISQNHRIVGVGSDLERSSRPTALPKQVP